MLRLNFHSSVGKLRMVPPCPSLGNLVSKGRGQIELQPGLGLPISAHPMPCGPAATRPAQRLPEGPVRLQIGLAENNISRHALFSGHCCSSQWLT